MLEDQKQFFNLWKTEREYLDQEKQLQPELFVRPQQLENQEVLLRIGVELPPLNLPLGYIKYYPLDFIVEEVGQDGIVSTVDYEAIEIKQTEVTPFIGVDLVKIGLSTVDAVRELARALKTKESKIGTAGIKDAYALTAQKITLSGVKPDRLATYQGGNHFLKNFTFEKRHLKTGELSGNHFTILIRTGSRVDENYLNDRLNSITQNGFWNFYWMQRFGNRLLSHWWGLCLIQGKQEKAIRSYLCDSGIYEIPFIVKLRQEANKNFGNWDEMVNIFSPLPYTFRYELIILKYLKEFRFDYVGALRTIPEQTKLWVYAYVSFLANKVLSLFCSANRDECPNELPLVLSNKSTDRNIYQKFLEADKVADNFEKKLKRFDFIKFTQRTIPVKIFPKIIGSKIIPEGVVIFFELPKGAYATTFLAHLFTLIEGLPTPEWVKTNQYDLKELLGFGSIDKTKEKFKDYTISKDEVFS